MRAEGFVSVPMLVIGTATTAATGAAAHVAEVAVTYVEPVWLSIALKYVSFGAGLATLCAALFNMYLGYRKDRREQKAADAIKR